MVLFGIIYSVDCHPAVTLGQFRPTPHRSWQITERKPDGTYDEVWGAGYQHRKYTGVLNRKQFQGFVDNLNLCASTVETMGSLGAPLPDGGIALGIVPAVSFDSRGDEYELNAYVTPFVVRHNRGNPEEGKWLPVRAQGMRDHDWDRLRDAMLVLWTDYPRYRSRLAQCQLERQSS